MAMALNLFPFFTPMLVKTTDISCHSMNLCMRFAQKCIYLKHSNAKTYDEPHLSPWANPIELFVVKSTQ
jgi:hypothetical protein